MPSSIETFASYFPKNRPGLCDVAGSFAEEAAPILTSEQVSALVHDTSSTVVCNFDGEPDDRLRMIQILSRWKGLEDPPPLIFIAGELEEGKDTMDGTRKTCKRVLGSLLKTSEDRYTDGNRFTLLRGAPLEVIPNGQTSADEDRGLRRDAAVKRLMKELGESSFRFQNYTSSGLFAGFPQSLLTKCKVFTNTCTNVLAPDGWIMGWNRKFDLQSYDDVMRMCQEEGIPIVHFHGSTLGYDIMSLDQLPDWAAVLDHPSSDATKDRRDSRFAMKLTSMWAQRVLSEVTDSVGKAAEDLQARIDSALSKAGLDPNSPGVQEWSIVNPGAFTEEKCDLTNSISRMNRLAPMANCPLTNTIGDFAAGVLDGEDAAEGVMYLALSVDLQGDSLKVIPLEEKNTEYYAVRGSQELLIAAFQEQIERDKERRKTTTDSEAEYIVDEELASEWIAHSTMMVSMYDDIIKAVNSYQGGKLDEETKQFCLTSCNEAKFNLTNGKMATIVRAELGDEAESQAA